MERRFFLIESNKDEQDKISVEFSLSSRILQECSSRNMQTWKVRETEISRGEKRRQIELSSEATIRRSSSRESLKSRNPSSKSINPESH